MKIFIRNCIVVGLCSTKSIIKQGEHINMEFLSDCDSKIEQVDNDVYITYKTNKKTNIKVYQCANEAIAYRIKNYAQTSKDLAILTNISFLLK